VQRRWEVQRWWFRGDADEVQMWCRGAGAEVQRCKGAEVQKCSDAPVVQQRCRAADMEVKRCRRGGTSSEL
jgi:hypothetical protein